MRWLTHSYIRWDNKNCLSCKWWKEEENSRCGGYIWCTWVKSLNNCQKKKRTRQEKPLVSEFALENCTSSTSVTIKQTYWFKLSTAADHFFLPVTRDHTFCFVEVWVIGSLSLVTLSNKKLRTLTLCQSGSLGMGTCLFTCWVFASWGPLLGRFFSSPLVKERGQAKQTNPNYQKW